MTEILNTCYILVKIRGTEDEEHRRKEEKHKKNGIQYKTKTKYYTERYGLNVLV